MVGTSFRIRMERSYHRGGVLSRKNGGYPFDRVSSAGFTKQPYVLPAPYSETVQFMKYL